MEPAAAELQLEQALLLAHSERTALQRLTTEVKQVKQSLCQS